MDDAILPHRDKDPVLTLHVHYFSAGELMLKEYRKLKAKFEQRGRLSKAAKFKSAVYFFTWLGYLAVTAEGFKKLGMRQLLQQQRPTEFASLIPAVNELGRLLKRHDDALRKVRNSVFHLRDSTDEIEKFFDRKMDRPQWAEELQAAFAEFFSLYRIETTIHYALNDRQTEFH